MKGIFRALLWLMAISLVVSVTHAEESDANTEQEFTDLQGIDAERLTEEADRNLQELDLEKAEYDEDVVDEGVLTDDVEGDSRRLQDEVETEDSFDEESSGMLDNAEEGEDRRLRFRQLKPAVTSWNYAPEPSKYQPIPSKKSSTRTSKKQKMKKNRARHIKKDYDHKKAAPAPAKYIPAPAPAKYTPAPTPDKLPEWTPAPSKKAPVIASPSKKGTSYKKPKVKKQKVKKSKKSRGHGNGKKY